MEDALLEILRKADSVPAFVIFSIMFAGAFLEYIFPPFPGDLVTAVGAILIARAQSFWTVFLGVNLGGLLGFLLDYSFGAWLANPHRRFRHWGPRWERMGRAIDRIAAGFQRHTAFYLMVNRFLPGIRALFFVAAGFARVPVWKVVVFGLLSSIGWNLLLIGAGYAAGKNLDLLRDWLVRYTWLAWTLLAAVVLLGVGRVLRKRWKARRETGG